MNALVQHDITAPPVARIANAFELAPGPVSAARALEASLESSGLDLRLLELVRLRASQINGCAFCIQLHVRRLLEAGEDLLRIHMLSAWRESTLYTPRERAALAWSEALTRLHETGAPDADYEALKAEFSPREQVNLTLAIGAINVWNRLQVGFRVPHALSAHVK